MTYTTYTSYNDGVIQMVTFAVRLAISSGEFLVITDCTSFDKPAFEKVQRVG